MPDESLPMHDGVGRLFIVEKCRWIIFDRNCKRHPFVVLYNHRTGLAGVRRMLKLLIADGTETFRQTLAENLKEHYVIRVCQEGHETLEMMVSFKPDLVVLDLTLPGLDGISVLQRAAESGVEPVVLATTGYFSDYISDAISRLNVGYVMMKPCDVQAATARLLDLTERMKEEPVAQPDNRTMVSNMLLNLGIATNLRGYCYLRDAILAEIREPGQQVTKTLYPDVGKPYGASGVQVERAIRTAIEKAWSRRNDGVWQQYFSANGAGVVPRPSNAAFISTLACHMKNKCGLPWEVRAG